MRGGGAWERLLAGGRAGQNMQRPRRWRKGRKPGSTGHSCSVVYSFPMKLHPGMMLLVAARLSAQATTSVSPAEAEPGAIVRLALSDSAKDAIVSVRGTMAGEPLRF